MLHGSAGGVCRACGEHVVPDVPSPLWKVAVYAGYTGLTVLSLLLMCLGPHMALSSPIWMFAFMGIMAPIHEKANEDTLCPACGRIFEERPALQPHAVNAASVRAV